MNKPSNIFLAFIEKHKGIIYKVAHSYCKDVEDRKDLIQEIVIQLWKSFDKYNDDYKPSTWIYRIALNVSISFYRKNKKRKEKTKVISDIIALTVEAENPPEQNPNLKLLQQFIQELKELDKALILLYLDEKSQQEIAEILGISPTNVSTKIARIKNKLKQKFSTINNT